MKSIQTQVGLYPKMRERDRTRDLVSGEKRVSDEWEFQSQVESDTGPRRLLCVGVRWVNHFFRNFE